MTKTRIVLALALSGVIAATVAVPAQAATPKEGTKWKGTLAKNQRFPKQNATLSLSVVESRGKLYLAGTAKITTTCQTDGPPDPDTGERGFIFVPGPTYTHRLRVRIRKGGTFDSGNQRDKNGTESIFTGKFTSGSKATASLVYGTRNGMCGTASGGVTGTIRKQ